LDTAGVPHGGRFGDVKGFAASMAKHGLTLMWFPVKGVFGLARQWGSTWKFQVHLCAGNDWEAVTPCTPLLERQILGMWDRHCRTTPDALLRGIAEEDRRRKSEQAAALYKELSDPSLRRETIRQARMRINRVAPRAFSIPQHLGRN
jgi:hypothetical protein